MATFAFRPSVTYFEDVNPVLAKKRSEGTVGSIAAVKFDAASVTGAAAGRVTVPIQIVNPRHDHSLQLASSTPTVLSLLLRSVHDILTPPSIPSSDAVPPERLAQLCTALFTTPILGGTESAAQTLYARIKVELQRKVQALDRELATVTVSGDGKEDESLHWLVRFQAQWDSFSSRVRTLRAIFSALDRYHTMPFIRRSGSQENGELLPLVDLANQTFAERVGPRRDVSERLIASLVTQSCRFRDASLAIADTTLADLPPAVISTLRTIRVLQPHMPEFALERDLLASAATYYTQVAEQLLDRAYWRNSGSVHQSADGGAFMDDYIRRTLKSIDIERKVWATVLGVNQGPASRSAKPRVREDEDDGVEDEIRDKITRAETTSLQEMLMVRTDDIIGKGLIHLFEPSHLTTLADLYRLVSTRAPQLVTPIVDTYTAWLRSTGLALVQDQAKDDKMIDRLLELRRFVDDISNQAFSSGSVDDKYKAEFATRKAFEWFINQRENKPAEMIAKYLDARLRAGAKGIDDAAFDELLAEVLTLLRFAQGKDMFEAFYKRDLAKRLLLAKSASTDVETTMLLKLKEVLGPEFTQQLETMFKDIEISNDIMSAYKLMRSRKDRNDAIESDAIDLNATVLTTGNWPTFEPGTVILPPAMSQRLEDFKTFYGSKYTGRSLSWLYSLHHCTVKATFPGGKKELLVSLHQALCLLLFHGSSGIAGDDRDLRFSYTEIKSQTGIDESDLKRTLQSLACGKVRVLTKHPKGRDVEKTDVFTVNARFEHELYRIRINQVQSKETAEEQKSTEDRVFLDREALLQLHIVRIMKGSKTMTHNELVHETVAAVKDRFKIDIAEIKKAIDNLIDREFLERRAGSRNTYDYLA